MSIHTARISHGMARRVVAIAGATIAGAAALGFSAPAPAAAASFPQATVHANGGLIAHRAPSTKAPRSYLLKDGATISIDCGISGTRVDGNHHWYLVSAEGDAKWVSGRYLKLHGTPEHCGPDITIPATTTAPTGVYQGPTKDDLYLESLNPGVGVELYCYTDAAPVGQPSRRWVMALEKGWIPAAAVHASQKIPYCQQS